MLNTAFGRKLPDWALDLISAPGAEGVDVRLSRPASADTAHAEVGTGRWLLQTEIGADYGTLRHEQDTPVELGEDWKAALRELRHLLTDPRVIALLDAE